MTIGRFKATLAAALGGVLALGLAVPAGAHVTVTPEEAAADSYAKLDFSVPHGCDGSATRRLRVQIPASVPSVTPQVHPGWRLETRMGRKDEVELNGETITRGVSEVIWTAEDAPLTDHYLDVFGIQVRLPDAAGETLHFPAIQECERGRTGWIQVPGPGESEDDLDEPAPALTLTAAEAEDDDGAPTGIAVAGVVLGALGLLAGGTSLARSRRAGG